MKIIEATGDKQGVLLVFDVPVKLHPYSHEAIKVKEWWISWDEISDILEYWLENR